MLVYRQIFPPLRSEIVYMTECFGLGKRGACIKLQLINKRSSHRDVYAKKVAQMSRN